jgi:hypothetical protein
MDLKLPTHLNLEFYKDPKPCLLDEPALLCHVEHDDYGNKIYAVPLKADLNGHISLDFDSAKVIE